MTFEDLDPGHAGRRRRADCRWPRRPAPISPATATAIAGTPNAAMPRPACGSTIIRDDWYFHQRWDDHHHYRDYHEGRGYYRSGVWITL